MITCVRDIGNYLKVWSHLFEAKEAFPELHVAQIDTSDLKKLLGFCVARVLVLLHFSVYWALILTYPMDVDIEDGHGEPGTIQFLTSM